MLVKDKLITGLLTFNILRFERVKFIDSFDKEIIQRCVFEFYVKRNLEVRKIPNTLSEIITYRTTYQ